MSRTVNPVSDPKHDPPLTLPELPQLGSEPSEDDIRRRAFEIFVARGNQPGDPLADWLQAENELRPATDHVLPTPGIADTRPALTAATQSLPSGKAAPGVAADADWHTRRERPSRRELANAR